MTLRSISAPFMQIWQQKGSLLEFVKAERSTVDHFLP
jgi:hypothetical protein